MRPLRITAQLSEPVVYMGDGMHLDGILAFGALMEMHPDDRAALPLPSATDWPIDFDLPLERWSVVQGGAYDPRLATAGKVWGWRASAATGDVVAQAIAEVRKRPPIAEMARYTSDKGVLVAGGSHKAWDLRFPTIIVPRLVWYVDGDQEGVERLLRHIPALGRKVNHGHGTVSEWRVEPWHESWSVERDGMLMRRMPHAWRPELPAGRGGIRPPYHHRSRACPSVGPEIQLSPGAAR